MKNSQNPNKISVFGVFRKCLLAVCWVLPTLVFLAGLAYNWHEGFDPNRMNEWVFPTFCLWITCQGLWSIFMMTKED